MAGAALGAKAEDILILDLRKVSYSFDFFFICSAGSDRRVQTVVEHIEEALGDGGLRTIHREGQPEGGWVLLDCGSVVGHVFTPEVREYYALERLWADAPHVSLRGTQCPIPAKGAATARKLSRAPG